MTTFTLLLLQFMIKMLLFYYRYSSLTVYTSQRKLYPSYLHIGKNIVHPGSGAISSFRHPWWVVGREGDRCI